LIGSDALANRSQRLPAIVMMKLPSSAVIPNMVSGHRAHLARATALHIIAALTNLQRHHLPPSACGCSATVPLPPPSKFQQRVAHCQLDQVALGAAAADAFLR
jgi:hypothetical protein